MDINLHLLATVGELNRLKEVLSPFQNNDRALLKRIINRKDDKSSKTLLQVACDCGHTGVVQYLLSLGRDVLSINEVNKGGNSALSFACMGGAELVVKALLEADSSGGFDVDIYHKNNEGNTALFLAAQGGHYGITVHLLLHETKKRAAALPSSPALEQLAGGHNAHANERNRDGFTPLLAAAHAGHADTVTILVAYGADVETCNSKGNSALHMASMGGHVEVVCGLTAHGQLINLRNRDGLTALMYAVYNDFVDIAVLLLGHGASYSDLLVSVDQKKLNRSSRERKLCVGSSCLRRCEKLLLYAAQRGLADVIAGLIELPLDGLDIYRDVRFLSTNEEDENDDRAYRYSASAEIYSYSSPFESYGARCDDLDEEQRRRGRKDMARRFQLKLNWGRRRHYCSFVRSLQRAADSSSAEEGSASSALAVFSIDALCTHIAAHL